MAKTYEMHMFKTASKKLGLDQAVLSGSRPQNKTDKQAPTKAEVRACVQYHLSSFLFFSSFFFFAGACLRSLVFLPIVLPALIPAQFELNLCQCQPGC